MNAEINLSVKDLTTTDDCVEKARVDSIDSFERLIDKLFSNINHDIDICLRSCKFGEETAPLCGREKDAQYYNSIQQILEKLKRDSVECHRSCGDKIMSIRKKE